LSDGDYELGLTDFETYYMIPNINSSNNKVYYDESDKDCYSQRIVQTA